jgi:hypothetical protein
VAVGVDTASGVEVGTGVEIPTEGRVQAKSPRKNKSRNRFILQDCVFIMIQALL